MFRCRFVFLCLVAGFPGTVSARAKAATAKVDSGSLWKQVGDKLIRMFTPPITPQLVKHYDRNHHDVVTRIHPIQAWWNGVQTIDVVPGIGCLQGRFTLQLVDSKRHTTSGVKTRLVKSLGDAKGEMQ